MEYLQDIFLKEKDKINLKKNFKDWLYDILSEKKIQVTYFDIEQYRSDYSDLEMAGIKNDYELIWHMIHHGISDFRQLFNVSHIDDQQFLDKYPVDIQLLELQRYQVYIQLLR